MEEDTHGLGVVEDHMLPWSVVGKKMCCCRLMLGFKKEGHWSTINLTTMIETIRAQLPK
jgi:hypothetical protein